MVSAGEHKFIEYWETLYPDIDLYSEYKFLPDRKFRFDFASVESKVGIEINGGNWASGRHTHPKALQAEYEKLNLATLNGWRVFVLSPEMIDEKWLGAIAKTIKNRPDGRH